MPSLEQLNAAEKVIARFDMRNCTTLDKSRELAKLVLEAAEAAGAAEITNNKKPE